MNWIDRNLPWVLLALAGVTAALLVGVVAAAPVLLVATLLAGATLATVLAEFAALLGVATTLLAVELVLVIGLAITVARRVSLPRSDRLATAVAFVERLVPPLRGLELSRRFEPTVEDRKRALKRRYVEGELSVAAFEREMLALLNEHERSPGDVTGPVAAGSGRRAEAARGSGRATRERTS